MEKQSTVKGEVDGISGATGVVDAVPVHPWEAQFFPWHGPRVKLKV